MWDKLYDIVLRLQGYVEIDNPITDEPRAKKQKNDITSFDSPMQIVQESIAQCEEIIGTHRSSASSRVNVQDIQKTVELNHEQVQCVMGSQQYIVQFSCKFIDSRNRFFQYTIGIKDKACTKITNNGAYDIDSWLETITQLLSLNPFDDFTLSALLHHSWQSLKPKQYIEPREPNKQQAILKLKECHSLITSKAIAITSENYRTPSIMFSIRLNSTTWNVTLSWIDMVPTLLYIILISDERWNRISVSLNVTEEQLLGTLKQVLSAPKFDAEFFTSLFSLNKEANTLVKYQNTSEKQMTDEVFQMCGIMIEQASENRNGDLPLINNVRTCIGGMEFDLTSNGSLFSVSLNYTVRLPSIFYSIFIHNPATKKTKIYETLRESNLYETLQRILDATTIDNATLSTIVEQH